jgi:hypothetical protein
MPVVTAPLGAPAVYEGDALVFLAELPYYLRRLVRRVVNEDHPVVDPGEALAQLAHQHGDVVRLVAARDHQRQ